MTIVKKMFGVVCMLMALTAFAASAHAQDQHFLAALSDLRTARDYLQYDKGQFGPERHHAIDEINRALDEVKRAAWDDGIQTRFAPPDHAHGTWDPLHEARKWLGAAKGHISEGADTPQTPGMRDRTLHHIDDAVLILNRLIEAGGQ